MAVGAKMVKTRRPLGSLGSYCNVGGEERLKDTSGDGEDAGPAPYDPNVRKTRGSMALPYPAARGCVSSSVYVVFHRTGERTPSSGCNVPHAEEKAA